LVSQPPGRVHAPRDAGGGKRGADNAIGRSRGGLSTKINAAVDERGLTRSRHIVADRGYDARALVELAARQGATAHIPRQRNRKHQRIVDPTYCRRNNFVERDLRKIGYFRRIATLFDKLASSFLAAVALTSIRLWARFHVSTTWTVPVAWPARPYTQRQWCRVCGTRRTHSSLG